MNRNIILLTLITLFIYACSGTPAGDIEQLQKLKKQRSALDEQIRELEKKILSEGGAVDSKQKIPTVMGQRMVPDTFRHFIEARGLVESDNNIFVPALRPLVVTKILVREGDHVTKGQLLAELNNESITQTIKEIKNGLELATTMYERQKTLYEKNIGTEVQYLQAKTKMEDLKIKLKNAQTELENTKIYAPIDGIVDLIDIKKGEVAIPNKGAIRISNLSGQTVKAEISENYITSIHKGSRIKVYFPVIDLTVNAKISAVSQVINPNNRTFDIKVDLPDNKKISPNMLAILTINDYTNTEAFVLPVNALQRDESGSYIYVARRENNRWIAGLRDVKTGKYSKDKVEITDGLTQGDVVITFGFNNISAGKPVNVSFNEL
jgi:RND family efflux transporter MFP subunit